jgi:predicted nucleic acid-binding protein
LCPVINLYSIPQTLYERAVFLDTSAFIELQLHNPDALDCKKQIDLYLLPIYTTTLIIAETHRRLLYDHSKHSAFSFLSWIFTSNITIIRHDKPEDSVAKDIVHQYWDLGLTFCDAVSFAVMLKHGIFKSFTYDCHHFRAIGFVTYPPFYP